MKSLSTESILVLLNPEQKKELLKTLMPKYGYTIVYQDCDNIKFFDYEPGAIGFFLSEEDREEYFWNYLCQEDDYYMKDGKFSKCRCGEYDEGEDEEYWDRKTVMSHFKESHYQIGCTIYRPQRLDLKY